MMGQLRAQLAGDSDESLQLQGLMNAVLAVCKSFAHADIVTIFMHDPGQNVLWTRWGTGLPQDVSTGASQPIEIRLGGSKGSSQGMVGTTFSDFVFEVRKDRIILATHQIH